MAAAGSRLAARCLVRGPSGGGLGAELALSCSNAAPMRKHPLRERAILTRPPTPIRKVNDATNDPPADCAAAARLPRAHGARPGRDLEPEARRDGREERRQEGREEGREERRQ